MADKQNSAPNLLDLIAKDEGLQALGSNAKELLLGALRGLTVDTVGAPVDAVGMAMNSLGLNVGDSPAGGSKWMRKLLDQPAEDSPKALAGNIASAALSPAKASLDMAQLLPLLGGVFMGPRSKLWDKDAAEALQAFLDQAPNQANSTKFKDEFFKAYGQFVSPGDKKIRQELSDFDAKLKSPKGGIGWLEDFLDHPSLYEAYPAMRGVKVKDMEGVDDIASFMPATKSAMLGRNMPPEIQFNVNSPNAKEVLLHEIQHGIQNLERFSPGGSPSHIKAALDADQVQEYYTPKAAEIAAAMAEGGQPSSRIANHIYKLLAGEAEARAVQNRAWLPPEYAREILPTNTYDVALERLINRAPR